MSSLGRLTPSYRAVFYCSSKGVAHFVTTREDIDSPSVKGDDQAVLFEQSEITLDIPAEGVVLASGWSITPRATSELRDEHTQHFAERVACFALRVKWTKPEEHPVELRHRIKLLGAKPPGNFITLKIEPPPQPSLAQSVHSAGSAHSARSDDSGYHSGAVGVKPRVSDHEKMVGQKRMLDSCSTGNLEVQKPEVSGLCAIKKKKLDNDEKTATPTLTQPAEHQGQQNERGGQRQGRRQRCRECIGCQPIQKENCGDCEACKDMIKFGGSGTRKKACIYHECQKLKYTLKDPNNPAVPKGRCEKCIGCLRKDDCRQCEACKTSEPHQLCRYRECQKVKYALESLNIGSQPHPSASTHQIKGLNTGGGAPVAVKHQMIQPAAEKGLVKQSSVKPNAEPQPRSSGSAPRMKSPTTLSTTIHQTVPPAVKKSPVREPPVGLTLPTLVQPTGQQSQQKSNDKKEERAASGAVLKKQGRKPQQNCGECIGCQPIQKEDCGECAACKDKPEFGGPGKRKIERSCIYHQCQKLKYKAHNSAAQGRCDKCIGCLRNKKKEDCGQCEACQRKRKFGGDGTAYKLCRYRECQMMKYSSKKFVPKVPKMLNITNRSGAVGAEPSVPRKSVGEKRKLDRASMVQKPEVSEGSAVKKRKVDSGEPGMGSSDPLPEKMKLRIKELEVENEDLRRQLHKSKSGYTGVPGVEVVGEEELLVTNETMNFQWKDYGFKLYVPENALPEGTPEYSVNIKASLSGQFELPKGYELASAVYWVTTPGSFTKKVTIEAQHCANFNKPSQLRFVQSAQKCPPYKFEVVEGGSFILGSKYGVLTTTHFSGTGIAKKVKPGEHSCQYCAQVYFTVKHLPSHWYYCHFVVTKNLKMCLTMVKRKYQQGYDIAPPITFGADHVALNIPDDGVQTDSGWEIVPVQRTQIERDRVDNFSSENTWVPECVLLLKWLRNDRNPNPLIYRVKLVGTGRENDFFRIVHHPDTGPSPPILPAPLVAEHQNIQSAAEENPVENPQVEMRSQPSSLAPLVAEHQNMQPAAVVNPVENPQIELTIDDLVDVTNYLLDLGTTHIYDLGLTLGLNQPHVRSMRDSPTFRDDVIAAWLQREDQVTRRGVPTWRTLVRALRDRRVNQTGVADTIAAERNVTE